MEMKTRDKFYARSGSCIREPHVSYCYFFFCGQDNPNVFLMTSPVLEQQYVVTSLATAALCTLVVVVYILHSGGFTRFSSGGFTSVAIVKKPDEKLVKSATVQYPPTSSQAFQRKEKSKQPLCQRHELCTPMQCMNVYTRPYISNFGAKIRSSHSILLYHHVQFSFKRIL